MPIATAHPSAYRIERAAPLSGGLSVPGDRLAAHLALAAAALAEGETVLEGLPQSAEFAASLEVVAALGPRVRAEGHRAAIDGLGLRGLLAPAGTIELGSGGLTAALGLGLAGILPMPTHWSVSGGRLPDALEAPLRAFGAVVDSDEDGARAVFVRGPRVPAPSR
jgi:3-phosphoshikimate 1-carboxyvinyltransferase